MIDSLHRASDAVKSFARGLLCIHGGDQPEICQDINGCSICNDNGHVIIESSDEARKVRGIRNRARDNIGSRNGIVEIRTGNQPDIHSIKNRTYNNIGNENGVVKIGKFPSA